MPERNLIGAGGHRLIRRRARTADGVRFSAARQLRDERHLARDVRREDGWDHRPEDERFDFLSIQTRALQQLGDAQSAEVDRRQ